MLKVLVSSNYSKNINFQYDTIFKIRKKLELKKLYDTSQKRIYIFQNAFEMHLWYLMNIDIFVLKYPCIFRNVIFFY